MSQPPQSGWGQQPSSENPYGPSSADGGWQGSDGTSGQGGYGQSAPSYGQASPAPGYGQPSPNAGYGQDPSFAPSFGAADGSAVPQGEPPASKGKVPLIIAGCCLLLVVALLVVGGGIFLFTRGSGETTGGGETTSEEQTDEETPTDEETSTDEETPTDEETSTDEETPTDEEPPVDDGKGTKDSPYAIGEKFTLDDGAGGTIDVTIGEVNWEATEDVMAVTDLNTQPEEGETYILVPLTVTYHGPESLEPGFSIICEYVSESGNTFMDEGTLTPNSWIDVGTLHDGGEGSWEIGIIIPADQAKTGMFNVSVLFDFSGQEVWVAAS